MSRAATLSPAAPARSHVIQVGIAGWSCRLEADTASGRARLERVFGSMREPDGVATQGASRVRVLSEDAALPRLVLESAARPYDFAELVNGPEWKRFVPLAEPGRTLYADTPMGPAAALEVRDGALRVLQPDRWPLYALLGALLLLLHEHPVVSLHAAVAAVGGHALFLVGASGSGKSTLSWALQQAGADCYGDELAFFTLPDFSPHPLRKGLCLRPGGVMALNMDPGTLPWYEAKPEDPKWSGPVREPEFPCPPHRGAFYVMDGFTSQPALRRMGGGEAARRLLQNMGYGNPSVGARLSVAGDLLRKYGCWAVSAGPPAETAAMLIQHARTGS